MATIDLGTLQRVDLREVWESEALGFTPWLARPENLKLLGDTIGIDLELEAQEKDVGPFRADILCKDTASAAWVLIENQLETTDHRHLGQLMTYAAGLRAVTIVWIARSFTEEHRAALDWLNEITDERFTFFGLEVELWRIANSPIAPKFNMVCKPNDWSKEVTDGATQIEKGELTDAQRLQLEFWTAFRAYVLGRTTPTPIRPAKPQPQYGMNFPLGKTDVYLQGVASMWDSATESYDSNEFRAEVRLSCKEAKAHFKVLESMKGAIEMDFGEALTWNNPKETRLCTIYVRQSGTLKDKTKWPDYHDWLLRKLEGLHRAFSERVKQLPKGNSNRADGADEA